MKKLTNLKNCFVDEGIDFNYDITMEIDGKDVVIAKAHTLTPKDMSYIRAKSFGKIVNNEGTPEVDIDIFLYNVAMIATAVDEWVFDRDVTFDNVNLLDKPYFEALQNAIMSKDKIFKDNKDGILKN